MLPQIAAGNAIEIILASDLSRLPDFAKPDARHKSEGLMSQVSRPGTGGRQPRVPAGFESTATAELRRKLGEPTVETHMGSRLELWETDTDGNTVVAARLSSEDVQKGENAMAQIDGAFALCEEHGLKPRYVIAATRLSGETKIENRLDLQFMMRAVEQGQVDSIVYREVDRLSRNPKVGEDFFSYLKNAEATLYLTTEQPNKVDWEEGMLLLRIKSGVAAHERSVIKRRTFSALERRMLLAGKGWPGSKRFGFRRDAQKYLEVDPEQWDFVERIHFDYSRLGETGRGSLSALAKHMKSLGCSFSRERLRTILHDPIYVTGEWDVVVRDTRYPGRTVQIPRPIPAEVQARNIALLKNTKGRNGKTTPFGTFLLNHIPFYHSRCMDEKVEKKKNNGEIGLRTPMLRGRNPNGEPRKRPPCYCHVPRPPAGCKNFAVESEAVDDGVVNVLLGMAESPELQLAFINGTAGIREVEDVVEDVNELRRRLGSLKRKHDVLVRSFIDEPQNDDISEARGIAALLAGVENDMEALGNRIELAETTSPARGRAPSETLREAMQRILVLGDDPTDEDRQRRVALVASLVSKVVLHHGEEGLELEVFGHLIPTGQMMVSADLRVHMRNAVGGLPEPSTKGRLSGRFSPRVNSLLPQAPAWKSARIHVLDLAYENNRQTLRVAQHCLRFVHERAEAGFLFSLGSTGDSLYDEVRREHPELIAGATLRKICAKHEISTEDCLRNAIGAEEALRKQRVHPRSETEMKMLIRWALEDGMGWGPGWMGRWEEASFRLEYLGTLPAFSGRARSFGTDLRTLIAAVATELGVEFAAAPLGSGTPGDDRETPYVRWGMIHPSYRATEFRNAGYSVHRIRHLRDSERVIGFRLNGDMAFYYPKWQFDSSMEPEPFVSDVIALARQLGLSNWDIQEVVNEEVEHAGTTATLAEFADSGVSRTWLANRIKEKLLAWV